MGEGVMGNECMGNEGNNGKLAEVCKMRRGK